MEEDRERGQLGMNRIRKEKRMEIKGRMEKDRVRDEKMFGVISACKLQGTALATRVCGNRKKVAFEGEWDERNKKHARD